MTSLIKLINLILCVSLLVLLISLLRSDHRLRQDVAENTLFSAQEILSKQALKFSSYALNNTEESLEKDDHHAEFEAISQLLSAETPNLQQITVYDEHGNKRYHKPAKKAATQQTNLTATIETTSSNNAQQLVLVEEVYTDGKLAGFVALTVDTADNLKASQRVMQQVEWLYTGFFICGVIISLLLVQLLRFLPRR